jgi:hypothetical protein
MYCLLDIKSILFLSDLQKGIAVFFKIIITVFHFVHLILNLTMKIKCLNSSKFSCTILSVVYILHPIREIVHFMNWPNFCPLHELASTLAYFTKWVILCSFYSHFMNWADLYVAFEVMLLMICKFVVPSSWTGQKMNKEWPSSWNG